MHIIRKAHLLVFGDGPGVSETGTIFWMGLHRLRSLVHGIGNGAACTSCRCERLELENKENKKCNIIMSSYYSAVPLFPCQLCFAKATDGCEGK